MAPNDMSGNGVTQNGDFHDGLSPNADSNSVLRLASKVFELAALQTHQIPVPQEDFLQAIQRLQLAVEGPAHYVARKRHEVHLNLLPD